jgi:hypothetical protein
MVHDLRAMCDAVAYVVKNGVEWAPCPSISPRGRRRRRSSSGGPAAARPWRWLPGCGSCCCARQGRAAQPTACIAGFADDQAHDTVPRATSGITAARRSPAADGTLRSMRRAGCSPWASPPRRQRHGRRETPAHTPVRRVLHAADHLGRHRGRRRPARAVRSSGRDGCLCDLARTGAFQCGPGGSRQNCPSGPRGNRPSRMPPGWRFHGHCCALNRPTR